MQQQMSPLLLGRCWKIHQRTESHGQLAKEVGVCGIAVQNALGARFALRWPDTNGQRTVCLQLVLLYSLEQAEEGSAFGCRKRLLQPQRKWQQQHQL